MESRFLMWVYRMISLYLSLWTQGPREHNRGATVRITVQSQTNYTTQAHRCLETFQSLRNHLEPAFYHDGSPTLYLHLYKEAYCMQYKLLLQCLHDLLSKHQNPDLLTLVQNHLIQPWAIRTNQLCDINVKKQTQNTARVADSFTPWKPSGDSRNSESDKLSDKNIQGNSESSSGNSNSDIAPNSVQTLLYMPRKNSKLMLDNSKPMLDSDSKNKLEILFAILRTNKNSPQARRTTEVVYRYETTKGRNMKQLNNADQSQMNKINSTSIQNHETILFQPSE